ncbi:MAG: biopolymer transporter ExbD [Pseudomonadota bacterium]
MSTLDLPATKPRRRFSLAPMIDLVLLVLIFFMLTARFATDGGVSMTTFGADAPYTGPPRLVEIASGGITLNRRPLPRDAVAGALARLMQSPDDAVLIRPVGDVALQQLVSVLIDLEEAGFSALRVVE